MAKKRFIKLGIILSSITGATILLGAGVNLLNSSTGISHSLRAAQVQIPEANAKKFDSIVIAQDPEAQTKLASYYYHNNFFTDQELEGTNLVRNLLEEYMKGYAPQLVPPAGQQGDTVTPGASGNGSKYTVEQQNTGGSVGQENTSPGKPVTKRSLSVKKMISIAKVEELLKNNAVYKEVYDKLAELVQANQNTLGHLQANSSTGDFYAVVQVDNADLLGQYRNEQHAFPAIWHLTNQWIEQDSTPGHEGIWNDIAKPVTPPAGNQDSGSGSAQGQQTRNTEGSTGSGETTGQGGQTGSGSEGPDVDGSNGNTGSTGSESNGNVSKPVEPNQKESNKSWYLVKFESFARKYDVSELQFDLKEGSSKPIYFQRKAFNGFDTYTPTDNGITPDENPNRRGLKFNKDVVRKALSVTNTPVDVTMETEYDTLLTDWNNSMNSYDSVTKQSLTETAQTNLIKALEVSTGSSITTNGAITYSATGNQITFHIPVWNSISSTMDEAQVQAQKDFVDKNYSITATLAQKAPAASGGKVGRAFNPIVNAEADATLNRSTDGSVAPVTVKIPVTVYEDTNQIVVETDKYAIKKTIIFNADLVNQRIINEALFDTNPNLSKIYAKIRTDFRTEILKQVKVAVGANYVELPSDNKLTSISFAVKTGQTVTPETKPDQGTDQGGGSTGQGESGNQGTGGGNGTNKPNPQEPTNPNNPETQLPPTDNPGTDGQTGGTVDKPQTDTGSGNQENVQQDNSNPSINNNSTTTENASNAGLITGISVSIAAIVVLSGFIGMNFYKKGSHRTSSETNTVESLPIEDKPADSTASKEIK